MKPFIYYKFYIASFSAITTKRSSHWNKFFTSKGKASISTTTSFNF